MKNELIINEYGTKEWRLNGQRHRTDGPAVEQANGDKFWYLNGKRHRLDGPAIELVNGDKEWFLNGKLHRVDGPAIEYTDGYKEWWLNSINYEEDEHPFNIFRTEYNLSNIYDEWLNNMKIIFKLTYGGNL